MRIESMTVFPKGTARSSEIMHVKAAFKGLKMVKKSL